MVHACAFQWSVRALLCALGLAATAQAGAANSYSFTDLGTLGGSISSAAAINNAGQVVGYSLSAGDASERPFLWSGGAMNDLTGVNAPFARATGINDGGQVIGTMGSNAFAWSAGVSTTMGTLGGAFAIPTAINNAGQVVGYSSDAANVVHGFYWNGGSMSAIDGGGSATADSVAIGIDSSGKVAGHYPGSSFARTYLWYGATAETTLQGETAVTIAGLISNPTAMSNSGEYLVGSNNLGGASLFRLSGTFGTAVTDIPLGTLPANASGIIGTSPLDVSNDGQVVGTALEFCNDGICFATSRALLWKDGSLIDLDSLLDADALAAGWHLWQASGINDHGWIVGDAYNSLTGAQHGFLLAPVPEPETYALLAAGLGFLGWAARRRRRSAVA